MNLSFSVNNFNSLFAKFIILASTIVSITPAILPFYYDIPYLLFMRYKEVFQKYFFI